MGIKAQGTRAYMGEVEKDITGKGNAIYAHQK
jgi:hypothetical protein